MTWAVQTTQCPPDSLSQQSKASSHHQSGPNKSLSDRLSKAHIRICYPTRCLPRRRKDGVSGAPGCIPRIPTHWDSPTHKNKASRILTGRLGSAAITRIRAALGTRTGTARIIHHGLFSTARRRVSPDVFYSGVKRHAWESWEETERFSGATRK